MDQWYWAILLLVVFTVPMIYSGYKIEKIKKDNDIQTYREITAFLENGNLDAARVYSKKNPDYPGIMGALLYGLGIIFLIGISVVVFTYLKHLI